MKTGKVASKSIGVLLTLCLLGLGITPSLGACPQKCCMRPKTPAPGHGAGLSRDRQPWCCCCEKEANPCNMEQDWSYEVSDIVPLTSQRPEIPSPKAAATVATFPDILFNSACVFRRSEKASATGPPIPIFLLNLSFLR